MAYECTYFDRGELVHVPGVGYVQMWGIHIAFDEWSDLGPAIKELVLPLLERDYYEGWEMCMEEIEDGRNHVFCFRPMPESEDDEGDGDSLFGPY